MRPGTAPALAPELCQPYSETCQMFTQHILLNNMAAAGPRDACQQSVLDICEQAATHTQYHLGQCCQASSPHQPVARACVSAMTLLPTRTHLRPGSVHPPQCQRPAAARCPGGRRQCPARAPAGPGRPGERYPVQPCVPPRWGPPSPAGPAARWPPGPWPLQARQRQPLSCSNSTAGLCADAVKRLWTAFAGVASTMHVEVRTVGQQPDCHLSLGHCR